MFFFNAGTLENIIIFLEYVYHCVIFRRHCKLYTPPIYFAKISLFQFLITHQNVLLAEIFPTKHKNTSGGYLYPHMYSLSDLLRYIGWDFWQRHVINLVNDPKASLITTVHQSYIRFKSMMIRYNFVWVISVPLKATLIGSWKDLIQNSSCWVNKS